MKSLFLLFGLQVICSVALAEMVSSDSIGNDPEKMKICATRAKVKSVPFEIDTKYVERTRALDPETIFIASDGISPQLIECKLNAGSGKFEPSGMSPEQSFWHLPRPKQHVPGINTSKGMTEAANVCMDAVPPKINRPNFDHVIYKIVMEVGPGVPKYQPGVRYSGVVSDRYDVIVLGSAFYKTLGIDLLAINFTCLLSPLFELKAIELR